MDAHVHMQGHDESTERMALSATLHCLTGCAIGEVLGVFIGTAFASDTLSITVMEIVDNAIVLVIPGAMDAGVGDLLFWGSLSVALVIAGFFAYPVNRWLLQRGKGHAAVHATGIHGGPSPQVAGAVFAAAGLFGMVVLIAEAVG
jgi:hypothetical protein